MSGATPRHAWVWATVFVLIWSTGFIVARYGMPHVPPFSFLSLRFALSIACFLPWIVWAKVAWPVNRSQWLHLSVTGVLMQAGYLGGVWMAVKDGMGSGLIALLVGFQPVLTALWLTFAARQQVHSSVSRRQWLGLLLGFVGLLMVVGRKIMLDTPMDLATPTNLAMAVCGLLSITAGTLYQKHYVLPCDVRSAITVQLLAAGLLTMPLAWMEDEPMHWNGDLVGAMAWSVLGLTLGGSSLLYVLLQRGAAASVTSLMYLVPPTTAVLAWWLFGETITLATLLGTALTAVGVGMVVRASRR
jgi:drug/metabolite transporter (DMT)-like permease